MPKIFAAKNLTFLKKYGVSARIRVVEVLWNLQTRMVYFQFYVDDCYGLAQHLATNGENGFENQHTDVIKKVTFLGDNPLHRIPAFHIVILLQNLHNCRHLM